MAEFTQFDSYELMLSRDNIPGHRKVFVRGSNDYVPAMTTQDLWGSAGVRQNLLNAELLTIASDSANDTAGGSGAWAVQIRGLDENYVEIRENIALNGTPVVTTLAFFRVNFVIVLEAGLNHYNEGTITVDAAASATRQALVAPRTAINRDAVFTVPAGHMLAIRGFAVTAALVDDYPVPRHNEAEVYFSAQIRRISISVNSPWLEIYGKPVNPYSGANIIENQDYFTPAYGRDEVKMMVTTDEEAAACYIKAHGILIKTDAVATP